jgi:galactitol-specific phosphotransferase system IIB component
MMKGKIAIEPTLTPIKDYLTDKGFTVECVNLNKQNTTNMNAYDAFVVSGMNANVMDIQQTQTKAIVINADGLTPEEVAKQLGGKF